MAKYLALLYGLISYLVFFITFLYAIGFVGNILVPKSIDSGEPQTLASAIITNLILLSIFAIQHSVMARPAFKQWWTKFIPSSIERSTYVLLSSLALVIMYIYWIPMTDIVWEAKSAVAQNILWAIFWLGWFIVLLSTFLINHFDLFGLRQVYLNLKNIDYTHPPFTKRFLYKLVRHPIMLGFIIGFWAIPTMTTGHLLFAVVTTIYILVALQIEERDLVRFHGEEYRKYQKAVGMIIPIPKIKSTDE